MFRLLALKVLDDCAACAHKVLTLGTLYRFCQDYDKDGKNEYTLKKVRNRTEAEQTLYDFGQSNVRITVSAIVGKNGDGKSSIVELILRVINNFAFTYGFQFDQRTLGYNQSVDAILYYEIDDNQYSIVCHKGEQEYAIGKHEFNVQWYENGRIIHHPITPKLNDDTQRKLALAKHHLQDLFYTLDINYSLYAYNSTIFGRESKYNNWIDGLFFKNDAYQTPLGITPFRDKGIIDVNKEEHLSQQRLMSLYVVAGAEDEKRSINNDKKAIGYAFSLEKESKLVESSILGYFDEYHEIEYEWNGTVAILKGLEEVKKARSINDENEAQKNLTSYCYQLFGFIEHYKDKIFSNKSLGDLIDYYLACPDYRHQEKTDFYKVIENVNRVDIFFGLSSIRDQPILKSLVESKWVKINYTQLYRLILIHQVWHYLEILNHSNCLTFIDCDLNEALTRRKEPLYAAKLYVLYKIIEILNTYYPYRNRSYLTDSKYQLIDGYENESAFFKFLYEDIETVLATDDYTTLKLRQTINYIKGEKQYYEAVDDVIEDFSCKYVSFESLYNQMPDKIKETKSAKRIIEFLPPPIFPGFIVVQSNDGERFSVSELSSGELQRLYSAGSFLYHLRNLACEQKTEGKVRYKNILVIFEEIELYFHPEYQKGYLLHILEQIKQLDLSGMSINLLFVSHSPFIITDILKNNTLYLKKGKPYKCKGETFAANLYDLMNKSFFLEDNAMGDCASRYVNKLVKRKNGGETISTEEYELVGDTIIKNYLQS